MDKTLDELYETAKTFEEAIVAYGIPSLKESWSAFLLDLQNFKDSTDTQRIACLNQEIRGLEDQIDQVREIVT